MYFHEASGKTELIGKGLLRKSIIAVSVSWAIFQLLLPQILILDTLTVRAVHLTFALILAVLTMGIGSAWLKKKKRAVTIPITILVCSVLVAVALYVVFDWQGIAERAGMLLTRDIVFGTALVVLLLEAVRRKVGTALSVIVCCFIVYAFFGDYFPALLAIEGVSLTKFFNQTVFSFEGIYGIPLGISASTIYLFVLLGGLLERAGAGKYFIDLAMLLVGRSRGGPAKAAVVSSALIGTVSGSSIANVATSGSFTIPMMKKAGFPAKKAAAIEVAASTDGQLMPPIMGAAAFIMAEYVNIPYAEVVKAALIPAIISLASLFFVTHFEAAKHGIRRLVSGVPSNAMKVFWSGAHYLIVIGVLLYELMVLRHSPELSVYKALLLLLSIIVLQAIYRGWKEKAIGDGLKKAGKTIVEGCVLGSRNMVIVALATAAAGIIIAVITMGFGGLITQIVETVSLGNVFLLLITTAVACIILGIGLPTTATYIVMASLTAPVIVSLGADVGLIIPLIAAHLFCFYFGILADDTPPVGVAAYAAATIAKSDPIKTGIQSFTYDIRDAIIPFMFILNTDLLLHNIHDFRLGVVIAVMGLLGALTFTSALQRWLVIKNRWYEGILLMLASLIFLNPTFVEPIIGNTGYAGYLVAIMILLITILTQTHRRRKSAEGGSRTLTPEGTRF